CLRCSAAFGGGTAYPSCPSRILTGTASSAVHARISITERPEKFADTIRRLEPGARQYHHGRLIRPGRTVLQQPRKGRTCGRGGGLDKQSKPAERDECRHDLLFRYGNHAAPRLPQGTKHLGDADGLWRGDPVSDGGCRGKRHEPILTCRP